MAYYLEIELKKNGTREEQERGNVPVCIDASKRTFTKRRVKPHEPPPKPVEVVRIKRRTISKCA